MAERGNMENKKDFSLVNCIAIALLAYFFTIPFHESIHAVTHIIYGDKVECFMSGAVSYNDFVDFSTMAPIHKIMSAGSASILNAIIGVVLLIVLFKVRKMPAMLRLFLTMLMGGQLLEGFGYFLIGTFSIGDWGSVFKLFSDSPGASMALRIVLGVLGFGTMVPLLYLFTYITYHFIEDPSDKAERRRVSVRLNLVLFIVAFIVGALASINMPIVKNGELPYWMTLFFNLMWFLYVVAFFYAWGGIMVKPPKESRIRCKLPKEAHPILWAIAVILTLIDIFIFGPGIYF